MARLLTSKTKARLTTAIGAAEHGHGGEIRVHIETRYSGDGPRLRARELFKALGMEATAEGTGVLLYLALDDRKIAVHAGPGVPVPPLNTWQDLADLVADGFRQGDGIGGLERALHRLGEVLRELLPGEEVSSNELPNEVTTS